MKKSIKNKILDGTMATTILGIAITACVGVNEMEKQSQGHDLTPLDERFKNSQIDTSEYQAILQEKRNELYAQLNNGDITIDQFKDKYLEFTQSYSIEDWAKEQANPKIHEILADYNSDITAYNDKVTQTTNSVLGGAFAITGAGLATCGAVEAIAYLKDKKSKKSNASAMNIEESPKFTPLPDPNGEPPCKEEEMEK